MWNIRGAKVEGGVWQNDVIIKGTGYMRRYINDVIKIKLRFRKM